MSSRVMAGGFLSPNLTSLLVLFLVRTFLKGAGGGGIGGGGGGGGTNACPSLQVTSEDSCSV